MTTKSRKPTTSRPQRPSDPVTRYALQVQAGKIVAGPSVRRAAARHLADLEHAEKRGFRFDTALAEKYVNFFPLALTVEAGADVRPFELMLFQQFIVGSLFGWVRIDTGFRRFRKGYIEIGKGNGKTPMAAGIGLELMVVDGELAAEVYAAGAKREQSMILFSDVVKMVQRSPRLTRAIRQLGNNNVYELRHRRSASVFKPLANDKKKSGQRVSGALVDELHEHQDRYTVDMLQDGFKGRNQPMILVTTNSGFDRDSICWEWHEHAVAVLEGLVEDDELFAFVCDLDSGDDPLEDESCWPKTNPGLGITIKAEYLRSQVAAARSIPGRENGIRRLNFCEWTDADVGWATRQMWTALEEDVGRYEKGAFIAPEFAGAKCFLGLDLSYGLDLASLSFAFPEGDNLITWNEFFMPGELVLDKEKTDRKPYQLWIREGLIHAVPASTIRLEFVAERLAQVLQTFDVQWIAYDRYRHKELSRDMDALNVTAPWIEHPQGFRRGGVLKGVKGPDGKDVENPLWMPGSVTQLEQRMLEKTIRFQPSVLMRGQVSAVAIRDDPAGTGNRIFDKRRATGRIDGIVALAMAVGAADMVMPTRSLQGFLNRPVMVK